MNRHCGKTFLLIFWNLLFSILSIEVTYRLWILLKDSTRVDYVENVPQWSEHSQPTTIPGNARLGQLIQQSPDSDRVYELKPNLDAWFINKHVRTNAFGFRGKDFTFEKSKNIVRIIGLGDSVMFGWGVAED